MKFIHNDFLLSTEVAKTLYHDFAEPMPIIDYHCHLNPKEIAEDREFDHITQLWLEGDHYKWRLMRSCGIEEKYITGDAEPKEKFLKWAQTIERCVGNPIYHWTMLELSRYFGYDAVLTTANGEEVWDHCNQIIHKKRLSARSIIKESDVQVICTTDSPEDDLYWHKKLKEDLVFSTIVLPAFRPDRGIKIQKADFADYMEVLEKRFSTRIDSYQALFHTLKQSIAYFQAAGCRTSDHGLDKIPYRKVEMEEIQIIFQKALQQEALTDKEMEAFQTRLLLDLAEEYARQGWVMQLHFGAQRDNNTRMYEKLGADTGYDCISGEKTSIKLAAFLNELESKGALPKTIVYSLDPTDNVMLDTVCGCFSQPGVKGKVQHGAAWWFNDSQKGILDQLEGVANNGVLGNFIGMLTDSRSLLSYTRHEYFRRILCNLLGQWVAEGLYPDNIDTLGNLVKDISYYNTLEFFNLKEEIGGEKTR